MCGRFTVTTTADIVEQFDLVEPLAEALEPRYNIAPTQSVPVISNRGERHLETMRWGLVPHWADDLSIGHRMINARGESLAEKPAFRDAYARRRCLVPADGFYEWKRAGKKRTPYYFHLPDHHLFGFAGLWERWKDPEGEWLLSFTIITAPANELVRPIHDRMPVVIAPADYDRWLHPDPLPPQMLQDMIASPADDLFTCYQVSPYVSSVAHQGPECIEPAPEQLGLF
jgi:putative SOS response-associated peptidase YedK